jgi:hypothetical protein
MVQETGREAPTGFLNERDRAPPTTRVKTEVFHTLAAAQRNEQPYGGGKWSWKCRSLWLTHPSSGTTQMSLREASFRSWLRRTRTWMTQDLNE